MYPGENKLVDLNNVIINKIAIPGLPEMQVHIDILRLDTMHPLISGNKWFKLKYYLQQATKEHHHTVLTFGGAYSNHIVATACAAKLSGLSSVGVIRGETGEKISASLTTAKQHGMKLHYISRDEYRTKTEPHFINSIQEQFGPCFIIPEGGAGSLGIKGSEEILQLVDTKSYTHIMAAIGTGTTFSGLAAAAIKSQQLIGIPVLKGIEETLKSIGKYLHSIDITNYRFFTEYHFGGYARKNQQLLAFMNQFYTDTGIPADFVYTGKLFYAMKVLAAANYFPNGSKVLVIHSGGLQGNASLPDGSLLF